jgi:hypothetical protein
VGWFISRGLVAGVCALGLFGAELAACGIDESGLGSVDGASSDVTLSDVGTTDGGGMDVVIFDNYVPPPCSDPDASLDASCLGTTLPEGWIPFAMQVDAGSVTCPGDGGDFTEVMYQTDPVIMGNNCVCMGCSTTSGWSCGGTLFAGGPTCNGDTQTVSGTAPYCWAVNHVQYGASISRSGSATCTANNYYGTNVTATSVAGCAPIRCQSDFCGLATQGFKMCARNDAVTDGGCPPGLPNAYIVGQSPQANCNACPTCSVANADAGCSALLTSYPAGDNNCDGGSVSSQEADGGCSDVNGTTFFNSLLYQPTVPLADCEPSGPTNVGGNPTVQAPLTVCCVN